MTETARKRKLENKIKPLKSLHRLATKQSVRNWVKSLKLLHRLATRLFVAQECLDSNELAK